MNKKTKIINLISNSLVFLLVVVAVIIMCINVATEGSNLVAPGPETLKFFTVQSNIFVGATSLASIIFILLNKESKILSIIKYVSVCSVTVTFLTVMFYLGPVFGMLSLLQGANLFMHLIIPVVAIIHLFIVEPQINEPKFWYTTFAVIPVLIYGIAYLANVAANNGYGDVKYDWYFFGSYGLGIGFLLFFIMCIFAYGIGVGLYFAHNKIKKVS